MRAPSPEDLDALLPQTQCGLCGHGGCMPYAEAMVFDNAAINLCPPGGVATLNVLAQMLNQDASPFIEDMQQKTKPATVARIREAECIGCTKCIQACPVDAIIGAAKQMHSIITDQCTGCELCVPPCPVDCIDLLLTNQQPHPDQNRARYEKHKIRLAEKNTEKKLATTNTDLQKKKNYIAAAILRRNATKLKKEE